MAFGRHKAADIELVISNIYLSQGRYDEGVIHSRRAVEMKTAVFEEGSLETASAILNLAITNEGLEDYRKARELYEKAIPIYTNNDEIGPELAMALVGLSIIHSRDGNHEDAVNLLERAIDVSPDQVKQYFRKLAKLCISCYNTQGQESYRDRYLRLLVKLGSIE